ncbi:PEPxxWA-CTERM sorting domain-containing protein [Phenylobacterium sp.]|uniref:PEPxxWA-CTERM sorting domain-containing protein n=1 Tax=Phenylobacterium sp. TaxID=1871053 RepID=UPI00286CB7FD|nr:PEPxxWA-CTERM sorting domain-containing protein [Phenylobacterium sp.]
MRKILWVAAAAVIGFAGAAHANITPVLTGVTAEGSLFRYTYQITLDSDQGFIFGSKIAIFDFAGFAGGLTTSNPTFAAGTELFTSGLLTPPAFTDDPTITNLTMTWMDGAFHNTGGPFPETQFTLSALSKYKTTRFDGYTATAVKNNGLTVGQATNNVGPVTVPFSAGVPEPASWAMLIVGFGGIGGLMRGRRHQRLSSAA